MSDHEAPTSHDEEDSGSPKAGLRSRWMALAAWKQIAVVVAVLVGVPGLWYLISDPNGGGGATRACKDRVEARLKAPSTAEFGDTFDSKDDQGRWEISGAVDSENGFGAMVRNTYSCTITRENGYWQLVDLSFSES